VRAFGKRHRIDLGTNHEGWNEERARVELERITAMVERGTWQPQTDYADLHSQANADETIHVTASRWWQRRERELRPNTRADYRWRLNYVLADLAKERTAELTARRVNEFRDRLARRLSPRSVNMVLDLLAQVLDDAVEDELLDQNPARGRRRRMKVPRASRSFLEPDMVLELLDVAGEWEASLPEHQRYGRRALLALLCLAGPRISEAITADRGDFDLAGGRWRIPAAKTDAGERDARRAEFAVDVEQQRVARLGGELARGAQPVEQLRQRLRRLAGGIGDREGEDGGLDARRVSGRDRNLHIRGAMLSDRNADRTLTFFERMPITLPTMNDVETLSAKIRALVVKRQELRAARVTADALEQNRIELVRSQWELSRALIERHLPGEPAA
jgi:integrase